VQLRETRNGGRQMMVPKKPVPARVGTSNPGTSDGAKSKGSGHESSPEEQSVQAFLHTTWRDLWLVGLIFGAAVLIYRTVGTSAFGPYRVVTLVPLVVAAYVRPGSAFYSALLGGALRLVLGAGAGLSGWYVLAPGVLIAGLLGSSRAHNVEAAKSWQWSAALFATGWMVIASLTFGTQEELPWWPQVLAFGTGLAFQLLVRRRRSHLSAWAAVAVSSTLLAAMTISLSLGSGSVLLHGLASDEAIADPNYLAMLIGLGIGPTVVLAKFLADGRQRLIAALVLLGGAVCFFGVVLLASRGALIAVVASLTLLLLYSMRTMRVATVLLVLAIGVTSSAAGVYWLMEYQGGELEIVDRFSSTTSTGETGDRLPIAEASVEAFADLPLSTKLFGGGPNSNFVVVGRITGTGWTHTHNAFLEYLLDFGVLGLGLVLGLFWLAFMSGVAADKELRILKFSQLCFLMLCSLSLNPFTHLPAVISLGLISARYRGAATAHRSRSPQRYKWAAAAKRLRGRWRAKAKRGTPARHLGVAARGR
jgi:nicotinamide riboside transporter PnuC